VLGQDRTIIGAIVGRMSRRTPQSGKRLHIIGWTYDTEGQRRYPRAIYAIGDKPNATKPKSDVKENRRRYRENVRKKYTANSVFNLGMTRRQYEALRREA
jgi:outer membrane usher protein FimD/PapC